MKKVFLSLLLVFVSLMLFACSNENQSAGSKENNPGGTNQSSEQNAPAKNEDELFAATVSELKSQEVINAANSMSAFAQAEIDLEAINISVEEIHAKIVSDYQFSDEKLQAAFKNAQAEAGSNFIPTTYIDNSVFIWTETEDAEKLVKIYTDLTGSFAEILLEDPVLAAKLNLTEIKNMIEEGADASETSSALEYVLSLASIDFSMDDFFESLSFIDEITFNDFNVIEAGKYQVKPASMEKWFGEDADDLPNIYLKSANGLIIGAELVSEEGIMLIDLAYSKDLSLIGLKLDFSMTESDGKVTGEINIANHIAKLDVDVEGVSASLNASGNNFKLTVKQENNIDAAIDIKFENNALFGTVKASINTDKADFDVNLTFDNNKIDGAVNGVIITEKGKVVAGIQTAPDEIMEINVTFNSEASLPDAAKADATEYIDIMELLDNSLESIPYPVE